MLQPFHRTDAWKSAAARRWVLVGASTLCGVAIAEPADTEDGEIIVITATRSEQPRAASPITTEVIDRARLAESGAQTVADALAQRPGAWIERGIAGTNGLALQGLGPQYTLVLVDGARQIGRTDGVLDLDRFAVEDLEQIEIVRGPSSVLHGSDALAGVVNLVTRVPRDGLALDALARIDGRLGREARTRIAVGRDGNGAALTASAREAAAVVADDGTTLFSAYDDANAGARAVYRVRERWRFDAGVDYGRRDLRGVTESATGAVFDRRNVVETAASRLAARWYGERTELALEGNAGIYRDQFVSDQRMADALDQYQRTDESLVEVRTQVARQFGAHRALVGSELLREALASERLAMPGERMRFAAFAQDEWRLGETGHTIVVPAARLDVDSRFGTHATPRLAARSQLTEGLAVRGSVGAGYRAPSFKELLLQFENPGAGYVVEGNPALRPETSTSVQLGGEWKATSWLWLAADAYGNALRDMIHVVSLPDDGDTLRFGYGNIGRVRTAGIEGYAIAARGRAAIELGFALTSARDRDAERALEGIPARRFTATLRWRDRRDRFDAFATAAITGRRPLYLDDDVTFTDPRVEVRARVAKRFASGFGGFLGVDNLLDAGDAQLDRLPPRTLYAGVEFHR